MQFDGSCPVTLGCARKLGEIMKYLSGGESPQIRYGVADRPVLCRRLLQGQRRDLPCSSAGRRQAAKSQGTPTQRLPQNARAGMPIPTHTSASAGKKSPNGIESVIETPSMPTKVAIRLCVKALTIHAHRGRERPSHPPTERAPTRAARVVPTRAKARIPGFSGSRARPCARATWRRPSRRHRFPAACPHRALGRCTAPPRERATARGNPFRANRTTTQIDTFGLY